MVLQNAVKVFVDDEAKLTLHGLVQHYLMINEDEKNKKLIDLLDNLDFNQVSCSWPLSHCTSAAVMSPADFSKGSSASGKL